jgi:hypothetical protein
MKYEIVDTLGSGTCLQGEIDISFAELVEKFGESGETDGYKVDAEWKLKFEDGGVATIYNYKSGKNYNGEEGLETEDIRDWHIGGCDRKAVERVYEIFGRKI